MKKILTIVLALALLLSFSACSAGISTDSMSSSTSKNESAELYYESPTYSDYSIDTDETDRIIIYEYSMNVRVDSMDEAMEQIQSSIPTTAWIESMSKDDSDGRIVLRIESGSAANFLDSVEEIGKVTRVSQSSEDVTSSYNNADQKVQVLEIEQERLIELLKIATVSEAIEINTRLSEIEISLKNLYGEMTTYESLAKYSTVTIYLYTDAVQIQDGFFARLGDALSDSWEFFQSVMIFVISIAVYAIPILGIVLAILNFSKKRKKGKKEETSEETE